MAFTFRVFENSARNYILQVNGADATTTVAATQDGATTGIIAANGYTPTVHLKLRRIIYNTFNCVAQLQWHATSNVNLVLLNGFGDFRMNDTIGAAPMGIWNDGGAGVTGDIDINSVATSAITAGATNPITASMSLVLFAIKGS